MVLRSARRVRDHWHFGLAGSALVAVFLSGFLPAHAQERPDDCYAPPSAMTVGAPLQRTGERLLRGEPVMIVAFGSSSTVGVGASDRAHTYPAQLASEFKRRFPGSQVTVLNKGINGEQSTEMLARLDRDVLAEHPSLVIWQTGSNEILHKSKPDLFRHQMLEGLARLKAASIEVVLMDAQYAPRILDNPQYAVFNETLRKIAREAHVALFDRFEAMHFWLSSGRRDWSAMVSPDKLHMNDRGYHCVAQLVASLIATDLPPIAALGGGSSRHEKRGGP